MIIETNQRETRGSANMQVTKEGNKCVRVTKRRWKTRTGEIISSLDADEL
jgi:hypothetical protein